MGERADHPADVDVFQVAEFADEIEDEPAALFVAQPPQVRLARLLGQIEGRVEDQLALLDPPARQPFDLHEELGAQSQERFFGGRFLVFADQRGAHAVPPFQLVDVVVAELGGDRVVELLPQVFVGGSRAGRVQRGEVIRGEIGLAEAGVGHEEGHLRPPLAVDARRELADVRQVLPQGRLVQRAELRRRPRR